VLVCRLRLRPSGGRDAFAGRIGDRLRIRVGAPPVEGKANLALVRFLARQCRVTRSRVRVVAGEFDRDKIVEIDRPTVVPEEILSCMSSSAQE
jgi:hypothetical protein